VRSARTLALMLGVSPALPARTAGATPPEAGQLGDGTTLPERATSLGIIRGVQVTPWSLVLQEVREGSPPRHRP